VALADETPRVLHAGNGTRGPFALSVSGVPFTYADGSEIRIIRFDADLVPTTLTEGVEYTLSDNSVLPDVGEEVQTVVAASFTLEAGEAVLAVDEFILAERITVPLQGLIARPNGGLNSAALERQFDVVLRHVQEIKLWMARSLIINALDSDGELQIPSATERAGKLLGFDDDGVPVADSIEGFTQGDPGTPGADGADGTDGADGSIWHIGSGVPSDGLGANTDFYLNSANGDVYGPKAAGVWGSSSGNLKGATGATGAGSGDMLKTENLSGLANYTTARSNLGLGSAAVLASSALFQVANNLSEGSAGTMRTNLGLSAIAIMAEATALQFLAATASKVLTAEKVWEAAEPVTLTDAATVAVDFSAGLNFNLTIGGNRTLGAPSNVKGGESGVIYVTQDGTGNRTLAYHANYKWAGASAGVLSVTAGKVDRLTYFARSSTFIELTLTKDIG